MAMSVTYTTINGQIVYENRGGMESFYVPDALGSTVALFSTSGTVTDSFSYWPYGEIASHIGSSVTPFTFVGTLGYYLDILNNLSYVKSRYLRQGLCRWQTVDSLWPFEPPYNYGWLSPVNFIDPSGRAACGGGSANDTHIYWNERRVIPGFGFSGICHWWLSIGCGRTGGNDFGYGPDGVCTSYIGNSDQEQVLETWITVTAGQKQCLCTNLHNLLDLGWPLCGSKWHGCDFNFRFHNCQDFVTCLCMKCGIAKCAVRL